MWIDGGIHAREWISPATVLWTLKELVEGEDEDSELIKNLDWYILPVHNPDGYAYSREWDRLWRKTRLVDKHQNPQIYVCPYYIVLRYKTIF